MVLNQTGVCPKVVFFQFHLEEKWVMDKCILGMICHCNFESERYIAKVTKEVAYARSIGAKFDYLE